MLIHIGQRFFRSDMSINPKDIGCSSMTEMNSCPLFRRTFVKSGQSPGARIRSAPDRMISVKFRISCHLTYGAGNLRTGIISKSNRLAGLFNLGIFQSGKRFACCA